MSTRFAGSRFLDERRRRRLASETVGSCTFSQGRNPVAAADADSESATVPAVAPQDEIPYRRLISPSYWKHIGISVCACLLAAATLAAGHYEMTISAVLGPGLARLFSFSTGRAVTSLSSALLLLAAQMALFIFLVRSNSLRDFVGRYRIWAWSAVAWLILAGAVATGAHLAITESALWYWKVEFWRKSTLSWLLPTATGGCLLICRLGRDMRDCRSSRLILGLATATFLLTSALRLEIISLPAWTSYDLVAMGASLFGSLFLFLSMLFHARYVAFESCEPPDDRPSRLETVSGQSFVSIPRMFFPNRGKRPSAVVDKSNDAGTRKHASAAVAEQSHKIRTTCQSGKECSDTRHDSRRADEDICCRRGIARGQTIAVTRKAEPEGFEQETAASGAEAVIDDAQYIGQQLAGFHRYCA